MKITKLQINNMFCYMNGQELVFDQPVYQVIGSNTNIENHSNGTGKSSLYYTIQEILFGKNLKNTLKEFTGNTNSSSKNYSGSVYFSQRNNQYQVITSRTNNKAGLILKENNVDISCHKMIDTYKLIQEIIGMDYELFTMLTYLSPSISTPNTLFLGTPKEKKDLLVKLYNLIPTINRVDKAGKLLTEISTEITILEGQLRALKPIEIPETPKLVPYDKPISESQEELTQLRIKQNDLVKIIKTNKSLVDEKSKIKITKIEEYAHLKHTICKQDIENKRILIETNKNKLKELKQIKEKCPMCGTLLTDNFDHIKQEIKQIEDLLDKEQAIYSNLLQTDKELEYCRKINEENEQKKKRLEEINKQIIDIQDAEVEYTKITDQIVNLSELIMVQEQDNQNYLKKLEEIKTLTRLAEEQKIEQKKIEDKLELLKVSKNKYLIIHTHLGYNGYLTQRIKNLTGELVNIINEYLSMFSGNTLLLQLTNSDKITFTLLKDNKKLPINNLSAGQTTILQLSSILGLRSLINARKNISVDLLVLDELFGTLDTIRRDILVDNLREISKCGGSKILSISHLYLDNSLPIINIIQENGRSRIEQ